MEERLAFSISTLAEGIDQLEGFLAGVAPSEQLFTGNVKEYKDNLQAMLQEADMAAMIDGWLQSNKQDQLMAAWCKGFPVDWEGLYTNASGEMNCPQRVSLPVYPFDRKYYWISEQHTGPLITTVDSTNTIQATPQPAVAVTAPPAAKPARVEEPFQLMTYEERWQEKNLTQTAASIKHVLCFASDSHSQQVFLAAMQKNDPAVQVFS